MKIQAQSGLLKYLNGKPVAVFTIEVPKPVTPEYRHTVLVLDCSVSMSGSIDRMKKDAKQFISKLGEKDFVSIVIFSGHDQTEIIVYSTPCSEVGRTRVFAAIEEHVRTIGVTVFSESFQHAMRAVTANRPEVATNHVILLTDGYAVPTKWDADQEKEKTLSTIRELSKICENISVIGYGVYYDEDFLRSMYEEAGYTGVYRHISDIDGFGPTIHEADEIIRDTRPVNIDLHVRPEKGIAGMVYRTIPTVTSIGNNGHIRAHGLYQDRTTLYVELSEVCEEFTLRGKFNGEVLKISIHAEPLTSESSKDFAFILAAYAYIIGDTKRASEIYRALNEENLAERAATSYTKREQRETADLFRRYYRDRKFIGEGIKASGPNHCVLNVLRTLIEDRGNVVYLKQGTYKRSGEMTRDPRVVRSPHGRSLKVMGYVSNQTRLNFSVRCLEDVKLLPLDNKGPMTDVKIWRTFNVILDGNLHLPLLETVLSSHSFEQLQQAGVIGAEHKYVSGRTYTVDLRGVKMISGVWANPVTLGFVDLLKEEAELEAEQKALNARCKDLMPFRSDVYTSSDNENTGFSNIYATQDEKVKDIVTEKYLADCVEIRLMKYKAGDYTDACGKMSYLQVDARVKAVRQRLVEVRFITRAITFAMETVKSKAISWDAGKMTQRGQWKKLEQLASFRGAQLKRVTWQEVCVCS